MKISIIIPAFNAERYISECLDSVINLKNVEIIVINDGSTDSTKEIVEKYKNVILFNNTNHGVSYSRNFGISKASGDYIMFIDADDYLKKDFETILSSYEFDQDVVYFVNGINNLDNKYVLLEYVVGLKAPCIAGPCCKLFRKNFLIDNEILFRTDIINGEDMLFNVECVLKLKTYKIINESIYMYRQNVFSATKTYNPKILDSDMKFHEYLSTILDSVDSDLKYNLVQYSKQNAVVTLIDRMSYINNYKEFKEKLKFLSIELYKSALKKLNKNLSIKSRVLILLMRFKLYKIGYLLLKLKHRRKNIGVDNYYFIEI